ncbi:efflux RND transporter permease subunit [Methylocystis parvus]|uniref:Multidrug transporter subunit MdtC n=1 Tax=Methylocystis parvus TaxID=134 RepID=A0A6B8M7U8_9HYPH|nr:efflux RND transporter permease subunit [Methylocystis parvus]QGM97403.1 multidrug transporter subunit MdtC [Methylocystis parvus]WBJ98684.1 efflux RND transporter permease subunit [Methylocystis parvus OBBP]
MSAFDISRPFILRPVATSLLTVAILLAGAISYRLLPVSALPQVDFPTIEVRTFYPGASPEVMASSITAPLERQLGQMPGLTQIASTSSGGASVITLQFNLKLTLDVAEQQVQAAINAAASFLPSDLPAPPIYAKINPADAPVLTLAIISKTLPLTEVQQLADTRIAQKISQLSGVGLVGVNGGNRPAVVVRANVAALASYGLSLEDLRASISNANVNLPKGNIDSPSQEFAIDSNDQLKNPRDYDQLIVAARNGGPIRLRDVAKVVAGAENRELGAWSDLTPAIVLSVQRQPGANVIAVVDQIKALLPSLQASLPGAVEVAILSDRTTTIRASIEDVQAELLFAVFLVIGVIYLFLRSWRATLVPGVAVPLSLVGALAAMYLFGYSLNNLTLMALTIATGFVVDDAIVMLENIARFLEQGRSPVDAALEGAREIGFTIVSLTISLIAVMIPLLFMGDVVGRLFREFAVTLSATIVLSAIVSLTLAPMLCSKLLIEGDMHGHVDSHAKEATWFDSVIDIYGWLLTCVLDHSRTTLAVFAITLGLTAALYVKVPKGFFPVQDTGLIQGATIGEQSASFSAMATRQTTFVKAALEDDAVDSITSIIGVDGDNKTLNSGRVLIRLKDRETRKTPVMEVVRRLQARASHIGGLSVLLEPVQDLTIDSGGGRGAYHFSLQDANPNELVTYTQKLVDHIAGLPQFEDVSSSAQTSGRALYVEIDRDAAARYGVTVSTIDNTLYDAFGQRIVSTIFTQTSQRRVILEADQRHVPTAEALGSLRAPGAGGAEVPLASLVSIKEMSAPLSIDHLAQFPATTISFNLAPGYALGDAIAALRQAQSDTGAPQGVITVFQGATAAFVSSATSTLLLILAAIVTVYIVLGVLYESYVHPLTILSTLPSAGVGALLALILTGNDLGVIGVIGIILLIGIVKKNAIMMIDFALQAERDEGLSPRDAIYKACLLRFRPILMTTLAALFGALPMIVGGGEGAELRFPLGMSIAGGLIVSQILTLFTTPVIYLAFDGMAKRIGARKNPIAAVSAQSNEECA